MVPKKRLADAATALLRKHGYTWAGRKRANLSAEQAAFEKRLVLIASGGLTFYKKR